MEILEKYKSLEYVYDIEWKDVFAVWRSYEAYQKDWEKHWIERDFKSWDEWRKNYALPIKPEKKKWKIYRIKNIEDIGNFYGVPSCGWIKNCYNGKITMKLEKIIKHPIVKNNGKVKEIINNFPYQTMLTGIIHERKVVLVEGMHRACALTVMAEKNVKYSGDVVIALAEHRREITKIGKGDNK